MFFILKMNPFHSSSKGNNEREEEEGEELIEVSPEDFEDMNDELESVWTEGGNDEDDVEEVFQEGEGEEGHHDDAAMEIREEEREEVEEDLSLLTFERHRDSVYSIAIFLLKETNKAMVLTGGGDDMAFLWSIETTPSSMLSMGSVLPLTGHADTVTSVGFNYDGSLCLTGSYDGSVKVWRVANGTLQVTLEGPEDVEFATWHSKGNAILAGSKDGTLWLWMAHNGQCLQVFAGHDGAVTAGMFTGDGKNILSGGDDGIDGPFFFLFLL